MRNNALMSFNVPASHLAAELGGDPPRGLIEALSPDELESLADSLNAAKRRQTEALDRAIKDALGHVPFVFRGAAELILL